MDRSNYGSTAEIISRITDPGQLAAMLKNPQYAGFTNVIIARLTEINHMKQAAQGAAPMPPTVAQQALQGTPAQQPQQPQQTMARGGIIAFKDGGKVKKDDDKKLEDYKYKQDEYTAAVPKEMPKDIQNPVPTGPDISGITADRSPVGIRGFVTGGETQGWDPALTGEGTMEDYSARPTTIDWLKQRAAANRARLGIPDADAVPPAPQAPAPQPIVSGPRAEAPQETPAPPGPQPSKDAYWGATAAPDTGDQRGMAMIMRGPGYNPAIPPVGSAEDYTQQWNQSMGPNTDLTAARAKLAELSKSREAQAANSGNMAMIRAGLGMMSDASTHPLSGTLGNFSTGATAGLGQYIAERDALNKDQAEELQRQVQLGQISRQEAQDKLRYTTMERRSDQQMARAMEVEKMRAMNALQVAQAHAGAYSKPSQIMDQRALQFGEQKRQQLIAQGTRPEDMPLPGDLYQWGLSKANAATPLAGVRSETAQNIARLNSATKQIQNEGDPVHRAMLQRVIDSGGTFDPSEVPEGSNAGKHYAR